MSALAKWLHAIACTQQGYHKTRQTGFPWSFYLLKMHQVP